jgi:fructokinase
MTALDAAPTPAGPAPAVVIVGEALIDLTANGRRDFTALPGGAPANAAVALARLGVVTEFMGRLSTDYFGQLLTDHLSGNDVGLRHAVRTARPTTLAVVHLSHEGTADYTFYVEGTADWHWSSDELPELTAASTSVLVAGSLALSIGPGAAVLEQFIAARHAAGDILIAYDPNVRPRLAQSLEQEVARVERQIRLAHVIKASEDDVSWLYPGTDTRMVARRWQQLSGGWVTITRGPRGAYAVCPSGEEVSVPGRPVSVVDTIGAGDAFLAGLLAGLSKYQMLAPTAAQTLRGLSVESVTRAMQDAVVVAALTCTRPGADPPTSAELELRLA